MPIHFLNNSIKNRKHLYGIILLLPLIMFCSKPKAGKKPAPQIQSPADTTQTEKSTESTTTPDTQKNRTVQEMWADFYSAKDSVDAALNRANFSSVKSYLKKAAFHAMEVGRADIAAWQLNNIGYYAILEFKDITNYTARLQKIEKMRQSPEKTVYIKETKELFRTHFQLLEDATKYLEEAYELDKDFRDSDRTQKIYSNLTFIDWVRNFSNN